MSGYSYGAPVERGRVLRVSDGRAVVESVDRDGLITPPIMILAGLTVSDGDTVFFCAFEDGTGLVLAVLDGEG